MLKQRLIGALVLLLFGAMLWPVVFVTPEQRRERDPVQVPPPPAVDTVPLPVPSPGQLRQPPERSVTDVGPAFEPDVLFTQGSSSADPESESAGKPATARETGNGAAPITMREEAPLKPELDADGIPIAWVLQVATMSSRDKADTLRDELIGSQYKAFVRPLRRESGTLYRVYIGPRFERAALDDVKQTIDRRYAVDSLIARYVP